MLRSVESALLRSVVRQLLGAGALLLATYASAQTPASAQDATSQQTSGALETIIVTANKIAEPVQRVPATINVVSATTLADLHIQSVQELATVVGGLSLTRTSPSEQSISLRGIKMPSAGGSGDTTNTVESYVNDAPISVVDAFTTTFDIAQFEVLRGPQGTLRGRPSPSGALTITPQRPSFERHDGYIETTGSDHDGQNIQAAVGGPINDTLAFRVAGVYDHTEGTEVKNIFNGRTNFAEVSAGRATLTWLPIEKLELNVMQQYIHDDRDFYRQIEGRAPCAGEQGGAILVGSIACGRTFTLGDKIALTEGTNLNTYRGALTTVNARYQLTDTLEFDYVGGYTNTDYFTDLNFDFAGIGEANEFARNIAVTTKTNVLTNELRFQSAGNERYNFTYGVFTANNRLSRHTDFPPLFSNDASSRTTDLGVFTNQRFAVTDRDNVAVGVRYSNIKVENRLTGRDIEYHATTGNASYQHQLTDDLMAYLAYGTSFRPGSGGSRNAPQAAIPTDFGNFHEEKSKSWEVGFKSQWFERRLTANITYFDQKYDGYIASQFNIACTGVPNPNGLAVGTTNGLPAGPLCFGTMFKNAPAISKGIEFELQALLTPDWTLNLIYTYTDAKFDNALVPCNDYNGDNVPDVNGTPMVQQGKFVSECQTNTTLGSLPKTSASAMTNYTFHVGNFDPYIRANVITRDKTYFPQTARFFPGYTQVNAYVGVSTANWDFSLFAKNLTDKVVQDTDGGPWTIYGVPSGLRIGTVTNDRELGLTARYSF